MSQWQAILPLAMADFRERTRRYSYLITLGLTIYAAYIFVPPLDANYTTLTLGKYRGFYNSAWIGTQVSVLTTVFLTLFGFYLVRGNIQRDRNTRVGEIIAATPVSRLHYVAGKTLSNFAVLASIVCVVAGSAIVMQLVRGESRTISPLSIITPIMLLSLPVMAVVSATAVLFETVGFLKGGLGNVVYFFGSIAVIPPSTEKMSDLPAAFDWMGIGTVVKQIQAVCATQHPDYDPVSGPLAAGIQVGNGGYIALKSFVWEGVEIRWEFILSRLLALTIAAALIGMASIFFNRFQDATEPRAKSLKKDSRKLSSVPGPSIDLVSLPAQKAPAFSTALTPLSKSDFHFGFFRIMVAELRLSLKGISVWWFIVAVGLAVAGLFTPLEIARKFILPISWIWPLSIWSALGVREVQAGTDQMIFSTPRPLLRQLPALWFNGFLISLVAGLTIGLRLILKTDLPGVASFAVAAAFIPSLALASGIVSRSRRLFEVLYMFLWYMGPMNHIPALDYTGASAAASAQNFLPLWIIITILLIFLAFAGRAFQLRR